MDFKKDVALKVLTTKLARQLMWVQKSLKVKNLTPPSLYQECLKRPFCLSVEIMKTVLSDTFQLKL